MNPWVHPCLSFWGLQSMHTLLSRVKNVLSRVSFSVSDQLQHSLVSDVTYILHLSASPKMKDLNK